MIALRLPLGVVDEPVYHGENRHNIVGIRSPTPSYNYGYITTCNSNCSPKNGLDQLHDHFGRITAHAHVMRAGYPPRFSGESRLISAMRYVFSWSSTIISYSEGYFI